LVIHSFFSQVRIRITDTFSFWPFDDVGIEGVGDLAPTVTDGSARSERVGIIVAIAASLSNAPTSFF
jgi:glycerol-3-phosphate dehydrogenase